MPLPEGWDGIFYSKETNGDMLSDLEPDDFVATLATHRSEPEFLVAGAACDLFWNGRSEMGWKLTDLAHTIWPKPTWGLLSFIILTAKNIQASGADSAAIKNGVNNTVAAFFKGGIAVHVVTEERDNDS